MPQSANIHEHLSKLCSAMLFVCQKRDKVENEGYVDNVKTLLSKYGLARISLSAFYNWRGNWDSSIVPRKMLRCG
jgi:hypothetical protein